MTLEALVGDEAARQDEFPVSRARIFLGHAGVTALPRRVCEAMIGCIRAASENHQEFGEVLRVIQETRTISARFIGAEPEEIALLGPTSLGLSLFANGLPWKEGDELLCYGDDYPANVYPWLDLKRRGVAVRYLKTGRLGEITPELVANALTPRTRLVALASCNFLSGWRIDVDAIGQLLQARGILFSLDAIQTLGAQPLSVRHVDFLSADAHKWMLGPMAIGIVYVKKRHFELLRPTLLGAWNVRSPNFIPQAEITFPETAQRYEPGVLNVAGIYGMRTALEMLLEFGMEQIATRLAALKAHLVSTLHALDFEILPPIDGPAASSITTFRHPRADMPRLFAALEEAGVVASLRHDRAGTAYLRFSPHFYNTFDELDRAVAVLRQAL
jgi:cysteine desulfurase/selenocysteine lyase